MSLLPTYDNIGRDTNSLLTTGYASSAPAILNISYPNFRLHDKISITPQISQNLTSNSFNLSTTFNAGADYRAVASINSSEDLTLTLTTPALPSLIAAPKIAPEVVYSTKVQTVDTAFDSSKLTLSGVLQSDSYSAKLSVTTQPSRVGLEGGLALKYQNFVFGTKLSSEVSPSVQLRSRNHLIGYQDPDYQLHFFSNTTYQKGTPLTDNILDFYVKTRLGFSNEIAHSPDILPTPVIPSRQITHLDSHVGGELKLVGTSFDPKQLSWGLGVIHRFRTPTLNAAVKARYNSRGFLGGHVQLTGLPSLRLQNTLALETSLDIDLTQLSRLMNAVQVSAKIAF